MGRKGQYAAAALDDRDLGVGHDLTHHRSAHHQPCRLFGQAAAVLEQVGDPGADRYQHILRLAHCSAGNGHHPRDQRLVDAQGAVDGKGGADIMDADPQCAGQLAMGEFVASDDFDQLFFPTHGVA